MVISIEKGQHFTLRQLRTWGRDKFDFNKEYQRSKIWNKERRQKLIDSIIKNLSIGSLILKKNRERFEVLDGQQRLQAIFEFIEGEFNTSPEFTPEFSNKSYEDLQEDADKGAEFDSFKIYYDLVRNGRDEEVADIFLRLQEGMPLNVSEKLNAMLGNMRNFAYNVSKTTLFRQDIGIGEYRFAHRAIAAQIALLEFETNFDHEPPEFPNLRFEPLKKMYEDYKTRTIPRRVSRNIMRTVDFLHNSLGRDARALIRRKSDLPLIFILASYLHKKYAGIGNEAFKNFIIDFFTEVEQTNVVNGERSENPFERYRAYRSKGLTEESFTERFQLLLGGFLSNNQNIQLRDRQKLFDLGQKLAIYYKVSNKRCQFCSQLVQWEDATFHHKTFRRDGGPTTVDNGELMHKRCHGEFHKNRGQDTDL